LGRAQGWLRLPNGILELVKAISAIAHHLAGLANIAELFGELQPSPG
jgi:hypothetical protein